MKEGRTVLQKLFAGASRINKTYELGRLLGFLLFLVFTFPRLFIPFCLNKTFISSSVGLPLDAKVGLTKVA